MAETNEEWELSKENIQPIQKGRRHDVLKTALAPHPEDDPQKRLKVQQRQCFEKALRTYAGDDPLAIWYKYIKWVEQNFPKGGIEGQIELLIERCLKTFQEEKNYHDDDRFIEIWLKFASFSNKPLEVFSHMHSKTIGCKSATFYVTWAWELEQVGNVKKAKEILDQGEQNGAEPFSKIESALSEFYNRVADKVKMGPEMPEGKNEDQVRSAFSILKPQKKVLAPISRVGHSVIEPNRTNMMINRQQHLPKSSNTSKVPFKIYNAENIPNRIHVQSENSSAFILHSENFKENEKKVSKWNEVKFKQKMTRGRLNTHDIDFKVHCDEDLQSHSPPKSTLNTQKALSDRKNVRDFPVALFEPPDPMKKPMYDKKKVYGGTEEFSLEEIRAAKWFAAKEKEQQRLKLAEQERKIKEYAEKECQMKRQIEYLEEKLSYLLSKKGNEPNIDFSKVNLTDLLIGKTSESYSEAADKIQELYNRTLSCFNGGEAPENLEELTQNLKQVYAVSNNKSIRHKPINDAEYSDNFPQMNEAPAPYMFYHDPTEELNHPNNSFNFDVQVKSQENLSTNNSGDKANVPYVIYQDPSKINHFNVAPLITDSKEVKTVASNVNDQWHDESNKDDIENVPPKEYIQIIEKRELAGILKPSKNIMYIPLELQNVEENSDADDEVEQEIEKPRVPDEETLVLPCNTQDFAAAAFMFSTPCASGKKHANPIFSKTESSVPGILNPDLHCSEILEKKDVKNTIQNVTFKSEKKSVDKVQSIHPMQPNSYLSVIMETSREGYSKSSSSSSSSVNLTKSIKLDKYNCYQNTNQKHISKLEALKEPVETPGALKCDSSDIKKDDSMFQSNRTHHDLKNLKPEDLFCVNTDPFDDQLRNSFLKSMNITNDYSHVFHCKKSIKSVKIGESIKVGRETYTIQSLISSGAYAEVYEGRNQLNSLHSDVAIKICKNANDWELYICTELHKRLKNNCSMNVTDSVMKILSAVKYNDGIALLQECCASGTLLDAVNKHPPGQFPELIAMCFTLELLHIVQEIHKCNIVHADIKPDNVLIRNTAFNYADIECVSQKNIALRLVDFGRAIDLDFFERGICFTTKFTSKSFCCSEMKDDKPWVFQLDWYGVLCCVHVMLFSQYMTVKKTEKGRWAIEKKLKRYWYLELWQPLFDTLLNLPSCYNEPDVKPFITLIQSKLQGKQTLSRLARLK